MKQYLNLLSLFLLASCSSEVTENINETSNNNLGKVILQSHSFEWDDDTRTSLAATDKSLQFSWTDGDAIGVFPIKPTTNGQAKQVLRVAPNTDAHFATFDGAGWELISDNSYAAYYPYDGSISSETTFKEVPIDLTGQDGTLATIGKKFDYMCAPSSDKIETTTDGTRQIVFDFQHVISIVQLKLTMPVAAKWERVSLYSSSSDFFISDATMDASTGKITPLTQFTSLNLNLNNVSTSSADETITLYVAVLPTTIDDLTIEAESSDRSLYVASLDSKTLVAGKAYRWSASMTSVVYPSDGYENGYGYVDLGLPSGLKWATMNVGANTPYDNGKYYAWGETKAYGEEDLTNLINYNYTNKTSYVRKRYHWYTYKWSHGDLFSYTKYSLEPNSNSVVDGKTVLDVEDDAAVQNWGGKWRMPTAEELQELKDKCYWVWTNSYNGSNSCGFIVYKALSSADKGKVIYRGDTPLGSYTLGNSHIFIPVCGVRVGGSCFRKSMSKNKLYFGGVWSSILNPEESGVEAFGIYLLDCPVIDDDKNDVSSFSRYYGLPIRAVCE